MGRSHRDGAGSERPRARKFIWAFVAVVLIAIGTAVFINARPLNSSKSKIALALRQDSALNQVAELRTSLAEFQILLEPEFATATSSPGTTVNLAQGAQLAQVLTGQAQALVHALTTAGLPDTARELRVADASYTEAYTALAPLLAGAPGSKTATLIAAERKQYAGLWSLTADAQTQLENASRPALQRGASDLDNGRKTVFIMAGFAALAVLLAGFLFGQRAYRRERDEIANAQRQSFASALQEALEMSQAEADVYGVVGKALTAKLPKLQVEMLVADSSRAHFHQALGTPVTGREESTGCSVASPLDCPATIRGHTLVFPTSSALNACPYLQDRPSGASSAACVPISIAGKTVGVTHAVGPDHEPPVVADIQYLEITSRRASERIAMLRAFEKSETQARSDPLTGLSNRRSLENRVRDLQRERVAYALAYGDLDHFKMLNDTHGHEAGDQALRLFSRVLRDSIRPNDIASRYGGEEFVLVLPNANTETAASVLARIRENLVIALTGGRVAPFTVSFGLASSLDADTFEEIVAVADRALLAAKAAGRNRVVVATAAVRTAQNHSSE